MKILYKICICCMLGLAGTLPAIAQLHQGVNLYTQNRFALNSAYASSEDGVKAVLQSTKVMGEYNNNLSLNRFTVQGMVIEDFGVGARVAYAKQGDFNSLVADLAASYNVQLSKEQSFRGGLSLGFVNHSANVKGFNLNEYASGDDPVLVRDGGPVVEPLIGAGFIYTHKKAQLAFSLPSMAAHDAGFFNQFTGLASYQFDSVQQLPLQLIPTVMVSKMPFSKSYTDVSIYAIWQDTFWVQPGIRSTGALMASFGVKVEEFNIGYGFGMPYGNNGLVNRALHEVVLSFQFL